MAPKISEHYQNREASAIRKAQISFNARKDNDQINVINLAIGNISLPMHPVMIYAMTSLHKKESPFIKGIVKYTPSVGSKECQEAIIHSIGAELEDTKLDKIKSVITDGGSQAMELMLLGVCGPSSLKPILRALSILFLSFSCLILTKSTTIRPPIFRRRICRPKIEACLLYTSPSPRDRG